MPRNIYDDILRDARVKLTEMFDNNFREQGFFGQKWVATKVSKTNRRGTGSILIVTGAMRRSIRSMVRGMAVVFSSNLPYTALHNEGGSFSVTVRAHSRTNHKTGNTHKVRQHPRQMNMPRRQFIGDHERVRQALADIVNKNLQEFSQRLADNFNRR
jgi:phage gpG-like protein